MLVPLMKGADVATLRFYANCGASAIIDVPHDQKGLPLPKSLPRGHK